MKRIIYDYENPHIVGKSKHSFPLGKIIVGIMVAALVIALVYIIFFRKPNHYKYESKSYFTVISGSYSSEKEALAAAKELRSKGGAGYILRDDAFKVVASVYSSEEDARSVANRYGYEVETEEGRSVEISPAAAEYCLLPEKLFDELYGASIALDGGQLSVAAASDLISRMSDKIEKYRSELDELGGADKLSELKNMYGSLGAAINSGDCTSAGLKYCLVDITIIYKNFIYSIS